MSGLQTIDIPCIVLIGGSSKSWRLRLYHLTLSQSSYEAAVPCKSQLQASIAGVKRCVILRACKYQDHARMICYNRYPRTAMMGGGRLQHMNVNIEQLNIVIINDVYLISKYQQLYNDGLAGMYTIQLASIKYKVPLVSGKTLFRSGCLRKGPTQLRVFASTFYCITALQNMLNFDTSKLKVAKNVDFLLSSYSIIYPSICSNNLAITTDMVQQTTLYVIGAGVVVENWCWDLQVCWRNCCSPQQNRK